MDVPRKPKIYHIVHVDRLKSIYDDQRLLCDSEVSKRANPGTTIGMNTIKQRRMNELTLTSHPNLYVGSCVPFYFCPRSVMLYLIHQANHDELSYKEGQGSIIHLQADLHASVNWAAQTNRRWAFTLSNAGSSYFEDRNELAALNELDWTAIQATQWRRHKEGKQAEFLIEEYFPWHLIEAIGVNSSLICRRVNSILPKSGNLPAVSVKPDWYY